MQRSAAAIASFALSVTLLILSFMQAGDAYASGRFFGNKSDLSGSEFLPVEEAFQISATRSDSEVTFHFAVTPGHYLYRHMFGFSSVKPEKTQLGQAVFPAGINKYDQFLKKELEIYPHNFAVTLPLTTTEEFPELKVKFQGCADAGLCYPPSTQVIIPIKNTAPVQAATAPEKHREEPAVSTDNSYFFSLLNNKSTGTIVLLFFLGGLALTFTPCVLPMIPIVSAMVANSQSSRKHAIALTASYVLAMALTYAAAGLLMAQFGAQLNLQARLQSPWILIPFAIVFILLALSMFGFYELQLPEKLRDRLSQADQKSSQKRQGTLAGAAIMGFFSTLLVSPCVSAPLAGTLVYISTTSDATLGGLALFSLGLGMGAPLFLIGAGGGALLPKAGIWMDNVKKFFGVMLLGVAIWLLERLMPASITLLLWGALAISCAIYLGALDFSKKSGWQAFRQSLGIMLLVYGISLFVGGIQGNSDPLRPLGKGSASGPGFSERASNKELQSIVYNSQELEAKLQESSRMNKPAVIDFYADWCISCKIFEREVLETPEVVSALSSFTLIKLDLTENTADHREILKKYALFGPPAFIFYNQNGRELQKLRFQGEMDSKTFLKLLKSTSGE